MAKTPTERTREKRARDNEREVGRFEVNAPKCKEPREKIKKYADRITDKWVKEKANDG